MMSDRSAIFDRRGGGTTIGIFRGANAWPSSRRTSQPFADTSSTPSGSGTPTKPLQTAPTGPRSGRCSPRRRPTGASRSSWYSLEWYQPSAACLDGKRTTTVRVKSQEPSSSIGLLGERHALALVRAEDLGEASTVLGVLVAVVDVDLGDQVPGRLVFLCRVELASENSQQDARHRQQRRFEDSSPLLRDSVVVVCPHLSNS